jgi:hypothetical protein
LYFELSPFEEVCFCFKMEMYCVVEEPPLLGKKVQRILGISNLSLHEAPLFVFMIQWKGCEGSEAVLVPDAIKYFGTEVNQFLNQLQANLSYFSFSPPIPMPMPGVPLPPEEGMDFEETVVVTQDQAQMVMLMEVVEPEPEPPSTATATQTTESDIEEAEDEDRPKPPPPPTSPNCRHILPKERKASTESKSPEGPKRGLKSCLKFKKPALPPTLEESWD